MALKLKSLRNIGVDVTPNQEVAARTLSFQEMEKSLAGLTADEVEYEAWKRVEVDGKKRMRIIKLKESTPKFKENLPLCSVLQLQ